MKHWKQAIGALALAMTSILPAQADLFIVADGLAGQDVQVKTANFDIGAPAHYVASRIDLNDPAAFNTLSVGVSKTGGNAVLGSTPSPGTLSFVADTAGLYSLLRVGEPDAGSKAGFHSIVMGMSPVLESALWLMIGLGVILVGVVELRATEHFG